MPLGTHGLAFSGRRASAFLSMCHGGYGRKVVLAFFRQPVWLAGLSLSGQKGAGRLDLSPLQG